MSEEDSLLAARRAKSELTQLDSAFTAVRNAMIERLVTSTTDQAAMREQLYFGIQALDAVREQMERIASGVPIAEYLAEIRDRGIAA